jgi:hypothetical protein
MGAKKASENKAEDESFIDKILNLFLKSGGPEAEKKRYLKQTAKDLAKSRFKFFKTSSDEVLPPFAKSIYDIYKAVYPVQVLFHSVQNPNAWKTVVINSFMDEKIRELADTLTEAAITEMAKTVDVTELGESVKADLDAFLEAFNSDTCILVDELYTKLMRFKEFCCFDFYQFLKKFDHSLKEGEFSNAPKFGTLNGEYALELMKDFMTAAWPLPALSDWQIMFAMLKESRNVDVISPNVWSKIVSRIEALKNSAIFDMMIRLITKNPYFEFKAENSQEHIIDSFLEKTKDEVEKTVKKIQGDQRSNKIDSLVAQIFGSKLEESLKNYTEAGCQQLARKKIGSFIYSQPLYYLKNFVLDYVKKDMREFADFVLIRGKWVNQSLATPMSNSYHVLLDLGAKIAALDESLEEDSIAGNKIRTLIPRVERDRAAHDILHNIVKETNAQAKELIVSGSKELINIAKYIKLLLEDHERSSPELMTNWKELEHFSQTPIKALGAEIYKKIYLFVQLMQAFFN